MAFTALLSVSGLEQGPAGAFRVQELGGATRAQRCPAWLWHIFNLVDMPWAAALPLRGLRPLFVSWPSDVLPGVSQGHSLSTSFALRVSATGRDLPSSNNTHSFHELWCQIWDRLLWVVKSHPWLFLSLKWILYKQISPSKKRKGYSRGQKDFFHCFTLLPK